MISTRILEDRVKIAQTGCWFICHIWSPGGSSRSQDFWKEFNRNKSRIDISNEVDGKTSSDGIGQLLAEKFSKLYSSVGYNENEMQDTLSDINHNVDALCMQGKCGYSHTGSIDDVKQAINQIKIGKTLLK